MFCCIFSQDVVKNRLISPAEIHCFDKHRQQFPFSSLLSPLSSIDAIASLRFLSFQDVIDLPVF